MRLKTYIISFKFETITSIHSWEILSSSLTAMQERNEEFKSLYKPLSDISILCNSINYSKSLFKEDLQVSKSLFEKNQNEFVQHLHKLAENHNHQLSMLLHLILICSDNSQTISVIASNFDFIQLLYDILITNNDEDLLNEVLLIFQKFVSFPWIKQKSEKSIAKVLCQFIPSPKVEMNWIKLANIISTNQEVFSYLMDNSQFFLQQKTNTNHIN